ncbi:MAG: carboxymuconolactone decarboxylase family protein [Rudaea sp.]
MTNEIPDSIESAPRHSQALLTGIQTQLGIVPSLFRLVSLSPTALDGFTAVFRAAHDDGLSPALRSGIALAVCEAHEDSYGLSMHRFLAKRDVGLDEQEIVANRDGQSRDPQRQAALKFALKVLHAKGQVSSGELDALHEAGFTKTNIIEIVQHIAFTIWSCYLSSVASLPAEFPLIVPRSRA